MIGFWMQGQDVRLRSSGYEPDEILLLHLACSYFFISTAPPRNVEYYTLNLIKSFTIFNIYAENFKINFKTPVFCH